MIPVTRGVENFIAREMAINDPAQARAEKFRVRHGRSFYTCQLEPRVHALIRFLALELYDARRERLIIEGIERHLHTRRRRWIRCI